MEPLRISLWRRFRRNWRTGQYSAKTRPLPEGEAPELAHMHEHLKKRDQVREVTRELLQTFGTLQPKLEHFAKTPLPDRASVIRILDDLMEVIYPGYFGRKYVERANIEYYVGDLLDSIYARLTEEIYRSVRPECSSSSETIDACEHCC